MPTGSVTAVLVTVADVERIAAIADPVARNYQITQCYHDLASTLATRTSGNANWCAFATWASKQAGQTIRGEDLEDAIEHAFDNSPALDAAVERMSEHAAALGATREVAAIRSVINDTLDPQAVVDRASAAVARGNLKVFAEIGREFARFLAERFADTQFDAGAIARFCEGLRAGEPPDGQRYLRQAFARYYRALFEPNPKARAELMFFANAEVGSHEQARLQPEILAALNAAVLDADELRARIVAVLLPRQAGWLARTRAALRRLLGGPTPLDLALGELVEHVRAEARRVITEHLMTLSMAHSVRLRLGADLQASMPPSLAHIDDPELRTFLASIDPTPDSLRGSGAVDWGNLSDRMHFIADLFRCYHESGDLLEPPLPVQ